MCVSHVNDNLHSGKAKPAAVNFAYSKEASRTGIMTQSNIAYETKPQITTLYPEYETIAGESYANVGVVFIFHFR